MKNYLFYDNASGEMFIVETDMKEKAIICARHYFEEPILEGEISYFEAEMLGYDTYQKGENQMDLEEILAVLLEDCDIDDIIVEEYEDFFIIEA